MIVFLGSKLTGVMAELDFVHSSFVVQCGFLRWFSFTVPVGVVLFMCWRWGAFYRIFLQDRLDGFTHLMVFLLSNCRVHFVRMGRLPHHMVRPTSTNCPGNSFLCGFLRVALPPVVRGCPQCIFRERRRHHASSKNSNAHITSRNSTCDGWGLVHSSSSRITSCPLLGHSTGASLRCRSPRGRTRSGGCPSLRCTSSTSPVIF